MSKKNEDIFFFSLSFSPFHSLSFIHSLSFSFIHSLFHSLSFIHSLSFTLFHSLSFIHSFIHSLSFTLFHPLSFIHSLSSLSSLSSLTCCETALLSLLTAGLDTLTLIFPSLSLSLAALSKIALRALVCESIALR